MFKGRLRLIQAVPHQWTLPSDVQRRRCLNALNASPREHGISRFHHKHQIKPAMASPFRLPDEETLAPLFQSFPCRERQIRSLATLIHVGNLSQTSQGPESSYKTDTYQSLKPHHVATSFSTARPLPVNRRLPQTSSLPSRRTLHTPS